MAIYVIIVEPEFSNRERQLYLLILLSRIQILYQCNQRSHCNAKYPQIKIKTLFVEAIVSVSKKSCVFFY